MIRRALLLSILATRAAADPSADYERAFRHGTELFERGDWRAARAEYESAYAIEPRPILLFNIASTYRRDGDRVNARLYYQRYLDTGDTALEPVARKTISEIDAEPAPVAPRAVESYPRAVLDRPLTLPAHVIAAAAGLAVVPVDRAASMSAQYMTFATLGGAYGITSRIQAGGELDLAVADANSSAFFAYASARWSDAAAARATATVAHGQLHYLRL